MSLPDVSVVMSVYNGGHALDRTINSVLSQTGVAFEFIIVNDGSTDTSQNTIESYAEKDSRIILINQENLGLTRALIAGCAHARGRFIARQDVGDISLEGRFRAQLNALTDNPSASLISSASRFQTPDGELLYISSQTSIEAEQGLKASNIDTLRGPSHHGSTMFPREPYTLAGGYRPEFYVAQDLDLWTRLAELGTIIALDKTHYCATVEKNSISTLKRDQQVIASNYILRCRLARANNNDESELLNELRAIGLDNKEQNNSREKSDAAYYYFLGSNLLKREPAASLKYFNKAFRLTPFNVKIVIKIICAYLAMVIQRIKH